MPLSHAVIWIDHRGAQVLEFDAEGVRATKVKAHAHHTRQHGSGVRSEHEFFAEVCAALAGIAEVLVTGSQTALSDFRHYVEKHRAVLVPAICGWEVVDHPTQGQLVALARTYFVKHDRMAGLPTPT